MKAVMANVPEHILEWRRRTGADRYDEMWEGVLHMAPSPNRDHQDLELALAMWLRLNWAEPFGCRVYTRINVSEPGNWPDNYRVPDIVLLTPERFPIDRNEYFDGGPDAVVEIRSPDDETYEKFEFYAKISVREVWVVDRDTRQVELFELVGSEFHARDSNAEGWLQSGVAPVELRTASDDDLEIRIIGRESSRALLP
jgi:Uma2 family endonuclease